MATKSKKKILYIITKSVWGGAQKNVYDLATNLPKDRFETFVATGGNGELVKKLKKADIECFNIKNFQRDINVLKEFLAYFELLWLFMKIRPDIVHTHSSKAGGIAGAATWDYKFLTLNFKVKTVFTVHGWSFHEKRPGWQIFLIKFLSFITALYYRKIICVSEYDRKSAIKNKIATRKKLITIKNGINISNYNFFSKEKARQLLITNYKLQITNLWIGTIGEDTKNKGHKYLKKAYKDTIIIKDLPQGWKYLKAFDIFILPSIKEGLPYILLEAGAAQIPVIATKIGGVPEIIDEEFLVKPANPEALKKMIEKFIKNPELRKKNANALNKKIEREFNFDKMLNSTISTYNE